MPIINKSTNNQCWRRCGEKRILLHCWWECNLVQPPWKTVWRFLRKLNIQLPYDLAIPLLGIYLAKSFRKRHMHLYDHYSPIHNSQDMETTQMSINRWIDQEDVVYIHNVILLSQKKNKIMPFAATGMELESLILSEVSQKEKTNTLWYLIFGI